MYKLAEFGRVVSLDNEGTLVHETSDCPLAIPLQSNHETFHQLNMEPVFRGATISHAFTKAGMYFMYKEKN